MSDEIHDVVLYLADKYLEWYKPTSDGKNLSAPCPFHKEKTTGAFYISTETGLFICHSCQARGNLHTFMKEIGTPPKIRKDLLDRVADKLFTKTKRETSLRKDPFENHMPLSESLLGVFDYCPRQLLNVGFEKEVLQKYDVGFDTEARRITFPIRDHNGVLMGIAGRTVVDEWPRYLIYKENDLKRFSDKYYGYDIHKKNFLWNMHNIYLEATAGNLKHLFIVEGFKAALWLCQHGAWNTTALMGTYLSDMQARLLQRTSATLIFFLDNTDHAKQATLKSSKRLSKSHCIRCCLYPGDLEDGTQPDNLSSDELVETISTHLDIKQWRRTCQI